MFIFVSISRGWRLLFKEDKDDACLIYLKYFLNYFDKMYELVHKQEIWGKLFHFASEFMYIILLVIFIPSMYISGAVALSPL